ncbi:MAG: ABC transporter ATP-binding protein, partial [Clostridiales bacterium]|nr:ABC transporter ATP-binding protein [Clostridiales bacterium]
ETLVKHFTQEVLVMYLGQMVEKAPVKELFKNPKHPYTQALLSAISLPNIDNTRERVLLKGEITSPINPKDECRFAPRCAYACDACREKCPPLTEISEGHFVRCFYPL